MHNMLYRMCNIMYNDMYAQFESLIHIIIIIIGLQLYRIVIIVLRSLIINILRTNL